MYYGGCTYRGVTVQGFAKKIRQINLLISAQPAF